MSKAVKTRMGLNHQSFVKQSSGGFTLIEVMVVTAITAFLTVIMLVNLSSSKSKIDLMVNELVSDIRFAQTKALSGSTYSNTLRCGYGIHFAQTGTPPLISYSLYVGPAPAASNGYCTAPTPLADGSCPSSPCFSRNYESSEDTNIALKKLKPQYEFRSPWANGLNGGIFFQPPNPTTYINNSFVLSGAAAAITIMPAESLQNYCPQNPVNCRTICVYPSGTINIVSGMNCP